MKFKHLTRGGTYYRVCDPPWVNCADTAYSKRFGGRWNPPGAFGALCLNASIPVAIANARRALRLQFAGAVTFDDLQDSARPHLLRVRVKKRTFADAVTDAGLSAIGLSTKYPDERRRADCQTIGLHAYRANEAGIAARSAVLASDEELAIFEDHLKLQKIEAREPFEMWYPGVG